MPNSNISEALKEAYASAPTDVIIFDTLEFRHPAFSEPIRVVADYVPLDAMLEASAPINPSQTVTFQAFAFQFTLPEIIDTGVPELGIKIDNCSREIMKNIELASLSPEKIEVTYRAFHSKMLMDGPQNDPPLHMTITSIEADALAITAKASIADFVNRKFPNQDYDDTRFPGLIADS